MLAVVTLVAALGLAISSVPRSSQAASPSRVHKMLQQVVQQFLAAQRHIGPAAVPRARSVPQSSGTCFVATGCSIRPCVVPVANANAPVPVGSSAVAMPTPGQAIPVPTLPNAGSGCPPGERGAKPLRVAAAVPVPLSR